MNEISTERRSVLITMAHRHGMEPQAFEQTLRATVMPKETTREQFAAFLMVARDYDLNPVTREIYAFPKPGGGIQPIVSVDGWMKLMNSHPQMDGMEFEDILTTEGDLLGIKASVFRKDRAHPTSITEYMVECRRPTEPWKQWPIRMLRHKAAIQAARYAFGFSGILDPDEFERWSEKPAGEKKPLSKRAMGREFKAWEPTGEPEVWDEPKAEEPVKTKKPDFSKLPPSSTPPVPPDVESAADAYELGKKAFRAHAGRTQWPGGWRDRINIDSWLAGWDDEKITAEIEEEGEERPA